jgi:hypothetical protein
VAGKVGSDLAEAGVGETQELSSLLASHEAVDLVGVELCYRESLPDPVFGDPGDLAADPVREKLL